MWERIQTSFLTYWTEGDRPFLHVDRGGNDPRRSLTVGQRQVDCDEDPTPTVDGAFCEAVWDTFHCWPRTPAGELVSVPCHRIFSSQNITLDLDQDSGSAYRLCGHDGVWMWDSWTNYSECLSLLNGAQVPASVPLAIGFTLFICSLLSMILLSAALFIFFYFRSLNCTRLQVHRNLMMALVLQSFLLLVIATPLVVGKKMSSYTDVDWLCKTIICLKLYAGLASVNWMFVEGLFLHSRITTSVFQTEVSFRLYYFIGWAFPLLLILLWVTAMLTYANTSCWEGYGVSPFVWIITTPMIIALTVNFIFLTNIVRILVTKLKSSVSLETAQTKKAVKATIFLFPLLGITHLVFFINPKDAATLEEAYMVTNAVLQASQGIFVSVLYCFMNTEVQTTLRSFYLQNQLRRKPNAAGKSWQPGNSITMTSGSFMPHIPGKNGVNNQKRAQQYSPDGERTEGPVKKAVIVRTTSDERCNCSEQQV